MYCSHCGKKVLDTMRFCPFCGTKIILPEQDEDVSSPAPQKKAEKPVEEERFTFDMTQEETGVDASSHEDAPAAKAEPEPVVLEKKEEPLKKVNSVRETPPAGDSFKASVGFDEEDDYDSFERSRQKQEALYRSYRNSDDEDDEDDDDEDDYEDGFFARHWKGLLVFLLLIALVGGGVFFAMTDQGQTMIAKFNYPLPFIKAETYGRLGYAAYQDQSYEDAGAYYERALSREPDSFNYAQSAAMAYIAAKDTNKAADMLKRCIELEPKNVDLYLHLLSLYPDASTRPAEVVGLIERGYAETGDVRLMPS